MDQLNNLRGGAIMKRFELKLDPARIRAAFNHAKLKKLLEYYAERNKRLRLNLSATKKEYAIDLDLRPSFYKLRPLDIQLQLRHSNFKLTPVASTQPNPSQKIRIFQASLYAANITKGLQNSTNQYRTSINRKYLTVNHVKKQQLDKQKQNYTFQLRMRPQPY